MSDSDVKAAAERLTGNWFDSYGCTEEGLSSDCYTEIKEVARAYLAMLSGPAAIPADAASLIAEVRSYRPAFEAAFGDAGPQTCAERLADLCESLLSRERSSAEADINRLNQMLRETGAGQGQIDAYVAQCEMVERMEAERDRLKASVRELESVAAARWKRDQAANGLFDQAAAVAYDLRLAITNKEVEKTWNLLVRPLSKAVEDYRQYRNADRIVEEEAKTPLMRAFFSVSTLPPGEPGTKTK